jgi:RNA polymerase sigma factor (sigma-70 family)
MPMITLMVYNLGGSAEDAKDIFQDGLIILLEKIDDKNFVLTCKFKTFLYSVCENLWKLILEKRQTEMNYFLRRIEDDDEQDFTEQIDYKLYESIFYGEFRRLDPGDQKILQLYWKGISPMKIARKLGFTYGYLRKKKCEVQAEFIQKVKSHPDFRRIMIARTLIKDVVY